MSRPSRNTDKLLIEAGRELLPQTGVTGLNLRQVAAKAKVNLGMFHYHFKTKDEFARQVLSEIYEEFFKKFTLEQEGGADTLDQLRRALMMMGKFARDNRMLVMSLIRDVMNGNQEVLEFMKVNLQRHISVIMGLIAKGQQEGLIRKMPVPLALGSCMGAIGAPPIIFRVLEASGVKSAMGFPVNQAGELMFSDESIAMRVEISLRGLQV